MKLTCRSGAFVVSVVQNTNSTDENHEVEKLIRMQSRTFKTNKQIKLPEH